MITNNEAKLLIEDVLDTLSEVGNGVTDKMLHEACDKLFKFRDEWFNVKWMTDEVVSENNTIKLFEEFTGEPAILYGKWEPTGTGCGFSDPGKYSVSQYNPKYVEWLQKRINKIQQRVNNANAYDEDGNPILYGVR